MLYILLKDAHTKLTVLLKSKCLKQLFCDSGAMTAAILMPYVNNKVFMLFATS